MRITKKQNIDKDFILSKISDYQVYLQYMPHKFTLNQVCLSPFKYEKQPSFIIGNKLGNITHKAFNSEHKGGFIEFVMQLFNLDYKEAITKIAEDFNLISSKTINSDIIRIEPPDIKPPIETIIQVIPKRLEKIHLDYWLEYYQLEEDLKKENIFAIKKAYINKVRQPIYENNLSFAYYFPEIDKFKLYCPLEKEFKWRTNVPFDYIEGLENINGCDIAYISKSKKDKMVLRKALDTNCIITTQSENPSCFTENVISILKENSKRQIVIWDNDPTGVNNTIKVTTQYDFEYCNVPQIHKKNGLSDFADMAKRYNLKKVYDHFKKKNKI